MRWPKAESLPLFLNDCKLALFRGRVGFFPLLRHFFKHFMKKFRTFLILLSYCLSHFLHRLRAGAVAFAGARVGAAHAAGGGVPTAGPWLWPVWAEAWLSPGPLGGAAAVGLADAGAGGGQPMPLGLVSGPVALFVPVLRLGQSPELFEFLL